MFWLTLRAWKSLGLFLDEYKDFHNSVDFNELMYIQKPMQHFFMGWNDMIEGEQKK